MERKSFKIAAGGFEGRTFTGKAAGIGNLDRYGDVIAPGAFKDAIPAFLKSGGVLPGHDWSGNWIAMPKSMSEEGAALVLTAEWHTTPEAEEVRTVVTERMAEGLDVGLSIGFLVGEAVEFEDAAKLLAHCEAVGLAVDAESCKDWKGRTRLVTKVAELYEVSVVTVPANPRAVVTDAKKFLIDRFGGDGSRAGLPLEDHLETVLAAVEGIAKRFEAYAETREADGRRVSPERLAQAALVHEALGALVAKASRPADGGQDDPGAALEAEARALALLLAV